MDNLKEYLDSDDIATLNSFKNHNLPIPVVGIGNALGIKMYKSDAPDQRGALLKCGTKEKEERVVKIFFNKNLVRPIRREIAAQAIAYYLLHKDDCNKGTCTTTEDEKELLSFQRYFDVADIFTVPKNKLKNKRDGTDIALDGRDIVNVRKLVLCMLTPGHLVRKAMDEEGMDIYDLADHFDVTLQAIQQKLILLGINARNNSSYPNQKLPITKTNNGRGDWT